MKKYKILLPCLLLLAVGTAYGQAKITPDSTGVPGRQAVPNLQWSRKMINGKAVYYLYDADLNKTYPIYTGQYANSVFLGKDEASILYQPLLGYLPENITNKVTDLTNPNDNTYLTTLGISKALADLDATVIHNTGNEWYLSGSKRFNNNGTYTDISGSTISQSNANYTNSSALSPYYIAISDYVDKTYATLSSNGLEFRETDYGEGPIYSIIPGPSTPVGTGYTLTMPQGSGIIARLSDIPTLTPYVPYIGATTDINLGSHSANVYNLAATNNISANKIGLGTTTPNAALDVRGQILNGGQDGNLDPIAPTGNINFLQGSARMLMGWNRTGGEGEADFIANRLDHSKPDAERITGGFAFYDYDDFGNQTQLLRINGDGDIGIGVSQPGAKLDVNGTVHAKELLVDLTGFPDYVFNKGYHLPALEEVQSFIDENHHLPDMPTEREVVTNGLKIGEVQNILTKKIEELTLYIIEQKKQTDLLRGELLALKEDALKKNTK